MLIIFIWAVVGLLLNSKIAGDEIQIQISPCDSIKTFIAGPFIWIAVAAFWMS